MFYCDKCRVENEWPAEFSQSRGPCEVCGKSALCNDVPSSWLPDRKPARNKAQGE